MEIRKVYIDPDNTATLVCPNCGLSKTVNVTKFKGRADPLKIRCKCDKTFSVAFEFRRAHRKETNLEGYYCVHPASNKWQNMTVRNVSLTGIGFETFGPHGLGKGDEAVVRFKLDDASQTEIEKNVVIRVVKDRYLGCEFTDPVHFDKALGFYLMP